VDLTPSLAPDKARAAWDELYAAEGSDWFWWYGDDFDTDYKQEFDRLFRTHLRNVWTYAGVTPPDILNQPLVEARTPQGLDLVQLPLALITPTLDGMVSNFFEWRGAGTINPTPPLGAMWKSEGLFTSIFFGFDREHLYLRLDLDERSQTRQEHCTADVFIGSGIQHYIRCRLPSRPKARTASCSPGRTSPASIATGPPTARSAGEKFWSWAYRSKNWASRSA
jgi:hypothetical protein